MCRHNSFQTENYLKLKQKMSRRQWLHGVLREMTASLHKKKVASADIVSSCAVCCTSSEHKQSLILDIIFAESACMKSIVFKIIKCFNTFLQMCFTSVNLMTALNTGKASLALCTSHTAPWQIKIPKRIFMTRLGHDPSHTACHDYVTWIPSHSSILRILYFFMVTI